MAIQAGMELLRRGATAMEASVAVAAALSVLWPHLCGLGGDAFFFIFDGEKMRLLIANGFSGERIGERKERVPDRGPESVLGVPGAVSGWQALLNGAPFTPELLAPAIRLAEQGAPVDESLRRSMRPDNEQDWCSAMAHRNGDLFLQPRLSDTLHLMAQGRDFYCCKISAALCESLDEWKIPIAKPDFHFQHVEWTEPKHLRGHDCEIWMAPQAVPALSESNCAVTFGVVDDEGRAVFASQTLHRPWGSGLCCPRTGIVLQSSAGAFSRDVPAAPRQRPPLWGSPALIARNGEMFLAGEEHRDLIAAVRENPICEATVNG